MIVRKHRKRSYKETKEILQKKRPWLCQHSAPSFGAKDSDDRSDGGDMDGKELEEMPEEDRLLVTDDTLLFVSLLLAMLSVGW